MTHGDALEALGQANKKLAEIDRALYELRNSPETAPEKYVFQQIDRVNSILADKPTHYRIP